jgi:chaperonin GroEL (HSP60 family)
MGDATNMVIVLAGEMLKMAEGLIRIGLHPSDIVAGYEKAQEFALKTLDGGTLLPCSQRNITDDISFYRTRD